MKAKTKTAIKQAGLGGAAIALISNGVVQLEQGNLPLGLVKILVGVGLLFLAKEME